MMETNLSVWTTAAAIIRADELSIDRSGVSGLNIDHTAWRLSVSKHSSQMEQLAISKKNLACFNLSLMFSVVLKPENLNRCSDRGEEPRETSGLSGLGIK